MERKLNLKRKPSLKKIMIAFVAIIMSVIGIKSVSASPISYSYKYFAQDTRFTSGNNSLAAKAYIDKNFVYCIEYVKYVKNGMDYKTFNLNINTNTKNKLIYVLANGYPNSNLGLSNDYEAIFATQMAVWNFYNITFNNVKYDMNSLTTHSQNKSYSLSKAKTAANKLISQANAHASSFVSINPSIEIKNGDVTEKTVGNKRIIGPYRVKVTDSIDSTFKTTISKKSGNEYLSDENGNKKSSFKGTEGIYITTTDNSKGTGTIKVTTQGIKSYSLIGYTPSSDTTGQKQIALKKVTGEYSDTATYSWDKMTGSISVVKKGDDGKRLEGVEFKVVNSSNKEVARGTTNSSGYVFFGSLPVGNYKVIETKSATGYELNSTQNSVVVNKGKTSNIEVINKKIIEKAEILVIKKDNYDYRLSGVKFDLYTYSGKYVTSGTTNSNGTIRFTNLEPGTYKIVETETLAGYEIDTSSRTATITAGGTKSVEFVNYRIEEQKYSITIVKLDAETRGTLAGAVFDVYNLNNIKVDTITTNSRGRATTKLLPKGVYYFEEVKAPDGYISEDVFYDVNLSDRNVEKIVYNNKIVKQGIIRIIKLDKDTNKVLSGAKFYIYDANQKIVDTVVTNSNGIATSKSLPEGKYTFVEVEAPTGYILDSTIYNFELSDNIVEKKAYNEKVIEKTATIKIIKLDKDTNSPLKGVEFGLYDSSNKLIDKFLTDSNGEILIEGLKIDKYTIKELKGLDGYVVSNFSKTIEFNKENLYEDMIVQNEKIIEKTGMLKILKVDAKDNTPLEGAKFAIYDSRGTLIKEVVTNEKGEAYFYNLPLGKYTIKETSAPKNYINSNQEISIEFSENNLNIEKTISNEKGELPQTGSFLSDNIKIIGKISLVSMAAFIVIKNRNMFM